MANQIIHFITFNKKGGDEKKKIFITPTKLVKFDFIGFFNFC